MMASKLHLVILGLAVVVRIKGTGFGSGQDVVYQQDLAGTDYTTNKDLLKPQTGSQFGPRDQIPSRGHSGPQESQYDNRGETNKLDGPTKEAQLPFYYNNRFDCTKHQYAYGMYADMDFQCQVYHVCHNSRKSTFLCPQGTLFNQQLLVCDHWHSVDCSNTPSFYNVNEELGKISNRTRFIYGDRPSSHRRIPGDYEQRSPYSPTQTTSWQGQQFPSSHERSTPSSFSVSTTEAPADGYRGRDQFRYPNRFQVTRDQPPNYIQPPTGPQLGSRDQIPGHGYSGPQGSQYDNRGQTSYGRQKPVDGIPGSQQPQFNQPGFRVPGRQYDRGVQPQTGPQLGSRDQIPGHGYSGPQGSQYDNRGQTNYGRQKPVDGISGSQQPQFNQPGFRVSGRQYDRGVQPQTGPQLGSRDQIPGHGYSGPQGSQYGQTNYGRQKPVDGIPGSQQPQFNQPGIRVPERQYNHGVTITHYSQSRAQRTNQTGRASNILPLDHNSQRNQSPGSQYGRQSPSPSRHGQDNPDNTLFGSRYGSQYPRTSHHDDRLSGKTSPGSNYNHHQPDVSQDREFRSQFTTSDGSYGRQKPTTPPYGQSSHLGRSPEPIFRPSSPPNFEDEQKRFGTSDFPHGHQDSLFTRYGQQQPQSGTSGSPHRAHHPFTSHGGQIHPQARIPDSTVNPQNSSFPQYGQQKPHIQSPGLGHSQLHPTTTSQQGQQKPQNEFTGSIYNRHQSTSQDKQQQFHGLSFDRQHPPSPFSKQNQSQFTTTRPLYPHQQLTIPGQPQSRGPLGTYGHQQLPPSQVGQEPQYKSHFGAQRNRTHVYGQENTVTKFPAVYQPQTQGHGRTTPEFGPAQPLNRQPMGSEYGTERNRTSGSGGNIQGTQYGHHPPAVSYNRESKPFPTSHWQQPRTSQDNQPASKGTNVFQSENGPYNWQKPGSPQYSFQQPHYQNVALSKHQSTSNQSPPIFPQPNNRFNSLGQQSRSVKGRNSFNNQQTTWNLQAQLEGGIDDSKGNQDKNLKPILVYQHHIPVAINGTGSQNETAVNRPQEVPVYKVYYVRGDEKEPAVKSGNS